MTINPNQLAAALAEVRKAYRLLQAYHRRLCDTLAAMNDVLVNGGLKFTCWAPVNVDRLPRGDRPFFVADRWAWDLTPGYWTFSEWKGENKNGSVAYVRVEAIADTGYDDSSDGEPNPANFGDVERSETELRIELWLAQTSAPNWEAARQGATSSSGMYDGQLRAIEIDRVEYTRQCFHIAIAELVDKAAVQARVVEPLERWMRNAKPRNGT